MGHIFGDTDDITFGGGSAPVRTPSEPITRSPESTRDHSHAPVRRPVPPSRPERTGFAPRRPAQTPSAQATPPKQIEGGLKKLIDSMKPSFFPQGEASFRMTLLSSHEQKDPAMIARGGEGTLLIGTGFDQIHIAGSDYLSFPDMRLPYSERDRLLGWILMTPGFAIAPFQMILETLGFPHVYATRDVIAYIRDSITDTTFLDQCRFFEIFSPGLSERKIGEFTLRDINAGLSISIFSDGIFLPLLGGATHAELATLTISESGYLLQGTENVTLVAGELFDISKKKVSKHTLKFTFDTFYIDKNSVGVAAGYTLKDREILAENGVLTFVLEEDVHARAIVGHIFIDSRGFVHAQEMMLVHKEVLKGIRHTYEQAILANPRIERSELVQTLRRELTKYCYLLTGRTPVVMPVIIER